MNVIRLRDLHDIVSIPRPGIVPPTRGQSRQHVRIRRPGPSTQV